MRVSLRLCTYPLFILVGSGLMQMISSTRIYSSAKCESAYVEWQRKGLEYLYIIKKNWWDEDIRSQKLQTGRYNIWKEKKYPDITKLIKSNMLLVCSMKLWVIGMQPADFFSFKNVIYERRHLRCLMKIDDVLQERYSERINLQSRLWKWGWVNKITHVQEI